MNAASIRGDIIFSRTTNGALSWEPPRDVLGSNQNEFTVGNQIAVLPNGTLVDIFEDLNGSGRQPSRNQFHQSVIRSTDKGVTWSKVIDIATDGSVAVRDPDTGAFVRSGAGLPDIAVAPNGTLYAVWSDGRFSGFARDDVALSRSTDGGLHWSNPIKVNASPADVAAFTPAVDVAPDGTVAVSYYDFRNNTPSPSTLPTDAFVVFSHDGGATFGGEVRLTNTSFDLDLAPRAGGLFLGDYVGLDHVGTTFVSFFTQTVSGFNPTDVYASLRPVVGLAGGGRATPPPPASSRPWARPRRGPTGRAPRSAAPERGRRAGPSTGERPAPELLRTLRLFDRSLPAWRVLSKGARTR
jgi:hypothetical protein